MNDLIDIVIPAFRGGPYLRQAVESVLRQTSPRWRLHVMDDASPGTAIRDLVHEVNDHRVSYERHEANIGINAQFNRALTTGSAAYVVIMGEDDIALPCYVEHVLTCFADFPNAALVQPGVVVIDEDGRPTRPLGDRVKSWLSPRPAQTLELSGEALVTSLLRGNWLYFPSLCWRREAVGARRFPARFEVVQDLALLVEVLRTGHGLVVDPRLAFQYRRHRQSLSSVRAVEGQRFEEERDYFDEAAQVLAAMGWDRAARAARWHLTSRLHALTLLPVAGRNRDTAAVRHLLRHTAR